ncbi:dipeptidase PepE [Bowmanella yangjiangensis]|uniref:Dipeptidase PepE n=1 Tax=Bowmanella yangjiangensis TaxID=2811230 RepID=A0ABS3CWH6_9ALTE|nr:dipeptidase PepE [Bowmanella yangjiangensis]MBN7820675.1 dipeptidase PepE [Bowmanella yangjiangensis]
MKVLMLSSSREGQYGYLETARSTILNHLAGIDELLFVPFAGVTLGWDDYVEKVQTALPEVKVTGIHQTSNAKQAVESAQAIAVGGGNTFNLLTELYKQDLLELIRAKVTQGLPYIGWSAGSNICGNSIRTTNDMPIIEPPSFNALQLVPFQINPHYTDYQPPGHNGETRAQRLAEFMVLNPVMPIVAIREGSALLRVDNQLTLVGPHSGILFLGGEQQDIASGQDLSHLL